jgi:hypothetical protein
MVSASFSPKPVKCQESGKIPQCHMAGLKVGFTRDRVICSDKAQIHHIFITHGEVFWTSGLGLHSREGFPDSTIGSYFTE